MNIDKDALTGIGIILTFIIGVFNLIFSIRNNKKNQFINTITSSRIKWMGDLRENISLYISLIPINEPNSLKILKNTQIEKVNDIIKEKLNLDEIDRIRTKLMLLLNKGGKADNKIIAEIEGIYSCILQMKICYDIQIILDHDNCERQIKKLSDKSCDYIIAEYEVRTGKVQKKDIQKQELIIKYYLDNGYKVIDDCIDYCIRMMICNECKNTVKNLVNISQDYLKEEWERVKKESKYGDIADLQENRKAKKITNIIKFEELKDWTILIKWFKKNIIIKTIVYLIIVLLIVTIIIA